MRNVLKKKKMDQLGLYPLSVILSFLNELEGTSFLLTKKLYAKQVLPIFQIKANPGLIVVNAQKKRHKFQVSPVRDPAVLLQRLNTRRLAKRKRKGEFRESNRESEPETGLSTVELANAEWGQAQRHFEKHGSFVHSPPLELLRFLNQTANSADNTRQLLEKSGITLLVSYPRSGNTLLRTLLERTTGIVTGSDTRPDRTLSKALAEIHNLVGEGITQNSKTCFVKTHWPERSGCRIFDANRIVLIVRNPFDAIDSYWNLNATNTHTETVIDEIYERHRDTFEGLVKNEIQVWCEFHYYWLEKCRLHNIPLLTIRFEDLIKNAEVELNRIMKFMAADGHISPFWEARCRHASTTSDKGKLGSYQPRTDTLGVKSVGKSFYKGRYSKELINHFHFVSDDMAKKRQAEETLLRKFGYDILEQGFPNNFAQGYAPPLPRESNLQFSNSSSASITINTGTLVRPKDCPFGRAMRNWRLQHTNNDTEPFKTVPR